jgi:hypothetical protein
MFGSVGNPHNFRMLLQIPEYLLAIGVRDLGVDFGILDVTVAQVVSHVFNPSAGFEEVDRYGVAQGVDGSAGDTRGLHVGLEEMLHHPFLDRAFPAGEEVGACISADPHVRPEGFGRVAPEGLLAADAVLEATDPDAVLFEVDVVDSELRGFIHAQAVVVDQSEKGPVARGVDHTEESFEFILGEVFGKYAHWFPLLTFCLIYNVRVIGNCIHT